MSQFDYEYSDKDYQLVASEVDYDFGLAFSYDYVRLIVYSADNTNRIVRLNNGNPAVFYSTLETAPFNINISPFYDVDFNNIAEKQLGTNNLIKNGNFRSGIDYWESHAQQYDSAIWGGLESQKLTLSSDGTVNGSANCIYCTNQTTNPINLEVGKTYNWNIDIKLIGDSATIPTISLKPSCGGSAVISFAVQNGNNQGTFTPGDSWTATTNLVFQINNAADIATEFEIDNVVIEEVLGGDTFNDFQTYLNNNNNIYIKPNEIFNTYGLPQGNYKIQIDFLNQVKPTPNINYEFLIKQISTSRKEVRIKFIDEAIDQNHSVIQDLISKFNDNGTEYAFKHLLNIGTGNHIPIMNYEFDSVTDGRDNQSIILKLYDPLPISIPNLSPITIEREVLTTQTEDIYYFSEVQEGFSGDGLNPDPQENYLNPDGDNNFESYNQLSSSITDNSLQNIISSSTDNYPNLNTDYNKFENHTFFGSAKTKLENFKNKVETIQNYYGSISSSLSDTGVALGGDSASITLTRETLFDKIDKEINSFTLYEKFLYFDGQSNSTASAPGLGKNYADTVPVTSQVFTGEAITLTNTDGFNVVYRQSNRILDSTDTIGDVGDIIESTHVDLFAGKYNVQDKPFFNYSGSIYLSFILKGTNDITIIGPDVFSGGDGFGQTVNGGNPTPFGAFHSTDILKPATSASHYYRYVYKVSQSYWSPTGIDYDSTGDGFDDANIDYDIENITDWTIGSNQYEIVSGSVKTGSKGLFKIKDSTGKYPTTVVTESGAPFFGSCMPAGELFRINYVRGTDETEDGTIVTNIADIKISLNNPIDVLPFDNVYHTSSANWINWYNGIYNSASSFDTDNIHSLENNLPTYIQESGEYNDLKNFLALQGEQYDTIRNHVDSLGTLHNRGYKKTNSPPNNTLPILLQNMGWGAINPFTGDLSETLGESLSSVTSIDDIKNDTWRKTLNNLIYIYKSKGTLNSVDSLLNIYGYPSNVLSVQEFGGTIVNEAALEGAPNGVMSDNPPGENSLVDVDLLRRTGSISFTKKKGKLYRYLLQNKPQRTIRTKWWNDGADINTIEFVYKHKVTQNSQSLLESSGSKAVQATGSIQVLSATTSDFDGTLLRITSSDGTKKTYIFDDDSDGATGTIDGSGRVRIQINGIAERDEIATEISTSISHVNGHFGKIDVSDSSQFLTDTEQNFITSDGDTLFSNSSGSIILTQLTASVDGNNLITTNAPSMSVAGFLDGSDKQTLWDLRLVPSVDGISSSFEFRLNNTSNASSSILSNAVSMSTSYSKITDGQLWNVMLQRMTSSISGSGTNEYRLHTSFQDASKIKTYNYVTMSVSGGLTTDSNYYANQNWVSTGSRQDLTSSNLHIGKTVSGSLAQIKTWKTPLSISRFRQHTLNKFSTAGNTLNSYREELIYHFKLNENYITGSVSSSTQTLDIIDSAPTTTHKDYSFLISGSLISGSSALYGFDYIDVIRFGLQGDVTNRSDKNIIINPKLQVHGDLSPDISAIKPLNGDKYNKSSIRISNKLELYRSPQDFINNYILNNIGHSNFEPYYANPQTMYSASYGELDTLRKEFFNSHPIQVNMNDFIRAHENMFNHSIVEAVKSIVPARSTLSDRNSNFGVMIKPTILEKQKNENEKHTVETNPNLATGSIVFVKNTKYKMTSLTSSLELPKSGTTSVNNLIIETGSVVYPYSGSITISDSGSKNAVTFLTGSIEYPYSGSIIISESYSISGSEVVYPYSGSIIISESYSITNSEVVYPYSGSMIISESYSISGSKVVYPYSGSLIISDSGSSNSNIRLTGSKVIFPTSGSIDYASIANASFVNIHDSWGKGSATGSDTHFLNMAAGVGHNNVTSSKTVASYTFNFNNSGSHGMKVTITSFDTGSNLLTKTYVIATASAVGDTSITTNGALSSDSSSIHFVTGSEMQDAGKTTSGSLMLNLLAAITSSNGHTDKFNIKSTLTTSSTLTSSAKLELTQSGFGPKGNTPIIFVSSSNFSSSINQDLMSGSFLGGSTIPGYFNVGHIDTRNHFYSIGDVETYSSSTDSSSNHSSDFSNQSRFYNRELLKGDIYKDSVYESLIGGSLGNQTGRAMGKTRYFLTSSTGVITLPTNHYGKFSYPFSQKMYDGAQNINPGISTNIQQTDYSTASFYRIKVTGGENEIRVVTGGETVDNDRIIY